MRKSGKILKVISILSMLAVFSSCAMFKKKHKADEGLDDPTAELAPPDHAATDAMPHDMPQDMPQDAPAPAPDVASAPAPAPEAAPVPESKVEAPAAAAPSLSDASGSSELYTVKRGDTLMKIAFQHYGDVYRWKTIYDANREKLTHPNVLPKGTVLSIPQSDSSSMAGGNGERYLIKQGDTLGTIAEAVYGTKSRWKDVWKQNKHLIHNPNHIFAGFVIYYSPEAGRTVSSRREDSQAAESQTSAQSAVDTSPAAAGGSAPVSAEDLHNAAQMFSSKRN